MTNGEWLANQAGSLNIPKRNLDQVRKTLARAKKAGSDISMAKLMASHGCLEDDAMAYVIEYIA